MISVFNRVELESTCRIYRIAAMIVLMLSNLMLIGQSAETDLVPKDKFMHNGGNKKGAQKPNIILLFVDDYGWSDVGYRNEIFHTPNINQLKEQGFEFKRAYIPTPTCSPSRASVLTGKEAVRMQMVRHIPGGPKFPEFTKEGRTDAEFSLWPKDPVQMPSRNWLPLDEVTYAEKLNDLGYYNMFIGKWHLGHEPYHPVHQGFHEQFGTANAGHPNNYYSPFFNAPNPLKDAPEEAYLTDVLTDKAESFILNYKKEQPFMLSFWFYSVHSPFIGRKELVQQYKNEGLPDKLAEYAAMVTAVDQALGRIRKAISDKGIEENTVIFFISDQGGAFSNAPLSGGKLGGNTLGEGGARVPFLMLYPGMTRVGGISDIPVQSIDIFPTLIEIASGEKYVDPAINGVSLLPILKEEPFAKRNLYFFRSYEDQYAAVIQDEWKLVKYHSGKFELFNLIEDIGEKKNLWNKEVSIGESLAKDLSDWEKDVGY